jgi:hypothetical protein
LKQGGGHADFDWNGKSHRKATYQGMIAERQSMRPYYMTSHEIAVNYILPEKRMKLSRFHELNDPFELKPHALDDKVLRQFMNLLEEEYFARKGILCFSDNWRSPVMWAHYAAKHYGVCLGFDVPDEVVRSVEYNPERTTTRLDPTKEL